MGSRLVVNKKFCQCCLADTGLVFFFLIYEYVLKSNFGYG